MAGPKHITIMPAGARLPYAAAPGVAGRVGTGAVLVAILAASAALAALLLWLIAILLPLALFLSAIAFLALRAQIRTGRPPMSMRGA